MTSNQISCWHSTQPTGSRDSPWHSVKVVHEPKLTDFLRVPFAQNLTKHANCHLHSQMTANSVNEVQCQCWRSHCSATSASQSPAAFLVGQIFVRQNATTCLSLRQEHSSVDGVSMLQPQTSGTRFHHSSASSSIRCGQFRAGLKTHLFTQAYGHHWEPLLILLQILDKWTELLENGGQINLIYTNLEKAFDKIPHKRLISKLSSYRFK